MDTDNHNIIKSSGFLEKIRDANNKIINYVILVSLIFAVPAMIGMLVRAKGSSLASLVYFQVILIIILTTVYLTRKKTSLLFRVVAYFTLVALTMTPYALNVGVLGFWILDLLIILVLLSVFTEKKYAFLGLGIIVVVVAFIATLHVYGVLSIEFDPDKYVKSYNIWVAMLVIFIYVSILTISVISMQRTFFLTSMKDSIIAQEEAVLNEKKFRSIFNSSKDGILISDNKGQIIEVNKSLSDILATPVDEIKTKKTTDFVLEEYVKILQERLNRVFNGEIIPLVELMVKTGTGKTTPVEVSSIKIDYDNQTVLLSVVRDISERIESERKILNSVIKAEERERSRFAKEIHDGVGPLLSAAKIYANAFKDVKSDEEKEFTISKLNEIVEEAIISAKEVSNNLSPHVLKNFGLKGAIESFLVKLKQTKIRLIFNSNLEERLNEDVEVTLYRVVIELLNNSLKYAGAKTIFIELIKFENGISLAYSDDGEGFDINALDFKTTGMGLENIRSRIKSLNGKVKIWSQPGKGFKTDISLKQI